MRNNFDVDDFISRFKSYCRITQIKEFHANEIITTLLPKRNQICVLLEGEAQLITYDKNGNKKILYHYNKNEMFGEALFDVQPNKELYILAKKKSSVLFFPYDMAERCPETSCFYHIELLKNLTDLILYNSVKQNIRVELLTNRGVREKLISYFENISQETGKKTFELPLSLVDLSDYLMIERTAMMREIKRMKDEGIIKKVKGRITL